MEMRMEQPQDGPGDAEFVQSLARGLDVIKVFDAEHPTRTLSDVARATKVTRATARRSLHTLVRLGYVRSDGTLFTLTPKVLELGHAYLRGLSVPRLAEPHLRDMMIDTGETASLSVLDGDHVVHIARVATTGVITVSINVGARFPAYATAMGRVLLAGMEDKEFDDYLARVELAPLTDQTVREVGELRAIMRAVRESGFCIQDQELNRGLRAVAAPVRDRDGTVIAAANIAASVGSCTLEQLRNMLPRLQECAAAIERDLHLVAGP
jgi:IclR family pca regulon transcriptional regulator